MKDENDMPNPGSEAALDRGCICAVLDNGHGAGYMGQPGIFVVTAGCPLHALPDRAFVVIPAIRNPHTNTEETK